MSYFSVNLRKIRRSKGLSQSEFAKIFGLTRATVGAYEEGRAEPKLDKLIEIAKYFGFSVDNLITKEIDLSGKDKSSRTQGVSHDLQIPFVPLSEKKFFIKALVEQKGFEYSSIVLPGMLADIAIEVEEFVGMKNVIIFGRERVKEKYSINWIIGVTTREYVVSYGDENFDSLIKFWNICCLLIKDIDRLVQSDVRLQRIEAKLDYLINYAKNSLS